MSPGSDEKGQGVGIYLLPIAASRPNAPLDVLVSHSKHLLHHLCWREVELLFLLLSVLRMNFDDF
jgi:hypothetical protein